MKFSLSQLLKIAAHISLAVLCICSPAGALVIDNTDVSCVREGDWFSSINAADYFATDYEVTNGGDGRRAFTWSYEVARDGFYRIRLFYPAAKNRATNAKFTVTSDFGVDTFNVDQTVSPGVSFDTAGWVDLGIFAGSSGNTISVTLSNDGNGYLAADAVEIEFAAPLDAYIRDNTHPDCIEVGTWGTSTNKENYYGIDYRHRYAGLGYSIFEWPLPLSQTNDLDIYARWPVGAGVASNAPFTIRHAAGETTVRVDQRYNGGKWVPLGSFRTEAGLASIRLSNDADDFVLADAVMALPRASQSILVADDDSRRCLFSGRWNQSTSHQGAWGKGYHATKSYPVMAAHWALDLPESGVYELFVRWPPGENRVPDATYCIDTLVGRKCWTVNQRVGSLPWLRLGSIPLPKGENTVSLTGGGEAGYLIADAVKLEFVGPFTQGWYVRKITDTPSVSELTPMVDNGQAVWLGKGKKVIQLFDGERIIDIFNVLDNPLAQLGAPNMSQGKVVWRMYEGTDMQYIYMWDGTQVHLIDSYQNEGSPYIVEPYQGFPPTYHCLNPVIDNGTVAYPRWDGQNYEIFTWKAGQLQQMTNDPLDCLEPSLANGKISFVKWDRNQEGSQDVYFGDEALQEAIGVSPTDDQDPDTDGQSAVFCAWEPTVGKKFDIYRYHNGTLTNISFKDGGDYEPQVDGDLIVWHGQDGPGLDFDIYVWENGVTYPLANSDNKEQHPWVHGNNVVWTASDGSQYDIYMATKVE